MYKCCICGRQCHYLTATAPEKYRGLCSVCNKKYHSDDKEPLVTELQRCSKCRGTFRPEGMHEDTTLCEYCWNEEVTPSEQKEPFNFERPELISLGGFGSMDEVPDDVRKTEPKHVASITDLIRDEAKKRAMRNECNGIYKRSADVDVPACAICAVEMEAGYTLKTATGHVICASCHSKLYDTVETVKA